MHCASGYRSAIAASMLDSPGRTVVLINDDYDNAIAAVWLRANGSYLTRISSVPRGITQNG